MENAPPVPQSASAVTPVLEMAGVTIASIRAANSSVVREVNWQVLPGEFWAVGGLPASGKSDFLATAAGLLRPRQGTHRLFGRDLVTLREEERLEAQIRVGMVFGQGGRLFNHLTVAENLALPVCYHRNCSPGGGEARVEAVLQAMELKAIAGILPGAVNPNLRQRAALARALILSPELLILDNPLAGLDPREARWLLEFLDGLKQGSALLENRPLTFVVGTDDLRPWEARASQFAFIHNRRFLPAGHRIDQIRQAHPELAELLPSVRIKD